MGAVSRISPQLWKVLELQERQRKEGQERVSPTTSHQADRGGYRHLPVAPPKALQGSELEPHLPSLAWGLNFLGFKMEMKAAPSTHRKC